MLKTIKQQILDRLNEGYTLTYGQANNMTNSQSGYRRMQEILKENPGKYRYVKVKSENGGYYNYFGKPSGFKIIGYRGMWNLVASQRYTIKKIGEFKTKKEAQAQIKKVVR